MLGNNLLKNCKLTLVAAGGVSAGTAVNSASVNMEGFRGVVFFGTIATANAANFANVAQSPDDSTFVDLAGTKVVPGDNGDSFAIDVYRPYGGDEYLRVELDRGGAATAYGDIYALQYDARKVPVTQGTTIDAETHISPAEGTA